MKYILRTLPYLRPYRHLAAVSVVTTILSVLASLLVPWPLKILIDNVLGSEPLTGFPARILGGLTPDRAQLLLIAVLAGLVVALLSNGLAVLENFVNTRLEQRIILDFRADLFQHAQRLSVAYVDQVSTGRLMYGINFEATAAGRVIMALQPLAQSALTLLGMVWIAFRIDRTLALLALTVVPFLYYSVGYYAKHIQQRLLDVKGMESESLSIVHEAMQMLRVITAFGREGHEERRFRHQGGRTVDARVQITVRQAIFSLVVNMTTAIGSALVLGFGAYHALQGQLTAGQLLVVLSYIAAVYKPLEQISYTVGSLQDMLVGLKMGFGIRDTVPIVQEANDATVVTRAIGRVTFERADFSYPSRADTLKGVSFEAAAGQVVAIVGQTGAGKTTLMNLIPRFYDPSAGRILLDGTDIRTLTLASLREQIALVPQEPILFSGTIADNIRYGRLGATEDEIIQAAKDANAHEFISRLPLGYDTKVGERGVQLSGGERQRICVARAFIKDAPILILDEPTSSIDSKTEAVILDALDRLMEGRTTFMIAHRLSTVRHADLILVLDRGELVEQGSHGDLLRQGGLYKQLYDLQIGGAQRVSRRLLPFSDIADADPATIGVAADSSPTPPMNPEGTLFGARIVPLDPPAILKGNERLLVRVRVLNVSEAVWPARALSDEVQHVQLGNHWCDQSGAMLIHDDGRASLPADVLPGQEVELPLIVHAPPAAGVYILELDMVQENTAWFTSRGSEAARVRIEVCDDGAGTPTLPPGVVNRYLVPAIGGNTDDTGSR